MLNIVKMICNFTDIRILPQNTTECVGSDVNITCMYSNTTNVNVSINWIIDDTELTPRQLSNSHLYQVDYHNGIHNGSSILTILSINTTTRIQCRLFQRSPTVSATGTITVTSGMDM